MGGAAAVKLCKISSMKVPEAPNISSPAIICPSLRPKRGGKHGQCLRNTSGKRNKHNSFTRVWSSNPSHPTPQEFKFLRYLFAKSILHLFACLQTQVRSLSVCKLCFAFFELPPVPERGVCRDWVESARSDGQSVRHLYEASLSCGEWTRLKGMCWMYNYVNGKCTTYTVRAWPYWL